MLILPVSDKRTKRAFHAVPGIVHRHDNQYIAALETEIEAVFDPSRNPAFNQGEAQRWVALDDTGRPVGRIACFYKKHTPGQKLRPGGCGFFDCLPQPETAFALFDTCKNWLQSKGCNALDGPINFGERDRWWGLVTEGFYPPVYGMLHAQPYYQIYFTDWGFRPYFRQYTYTFNKSGKLSPVFAAIAERLQKQGRVEIKNGNALSDKEMLRDFVDVYNQAWTAHEGVGAMTVAQAAILFEQMRPVMDRQLLQFAYLDGKAAGFFIALPDANQLLRYVNGKLHLWSKIKLMWMQWQQPITRIYGLVFGVTPAAQHSGLPAAMVQYMYTMLSVCAQYSEIELMWIGDFNKKMMNFVSHIQAEPHRTLITYRKIFDADIPFEPYPDIQ